MEKRLNGYYVHLVILLSALPFRAHACDTNACIDRGRPLVLQYGETHLDAEFVINRLSSFCTVESNKSVQQSEGCISLITECPCLIESRSNLKHLKGQVPKLKKELADFKLSKLEESCNYAHKWQDCQDAGKLLLEEKNGAGQAKLYFTQACEHQIAAGCDELKKMDASQRQAAAKAKHEQDVRAAIEAASNRKDGTNDCKAARIALKYCGSQLGIARLKATIDNERAIGAQSGFVNAATLRNGTAMKMQHENLSADLSDQYQKLTGKALSPARCNMVATSAPSTFRIKQMKRWRGTLTESVGIPAKISLCGMPAKFATDVGSRGAGCISPGDV